MAVGAATGGAGGGAAAGPALRLVAWVVGLSAVLAGAVAAGSLPALDAPPIRAPGELAGWVAAREPVSAAFALARVLVVVLAGYLLTVTVLGVLARLVPALRLLTLVDVVSVPAVRRVVSGALGVGLAGATVVPLGGAWASPPAATSEPSQPAPGEQEAPVPVPGPPTLHRLDHPAAMPGTPVAAVAEVTLRTGDHLWAVAERALADAWGRVPTVAEVTPYWAGLVEVNRLRLPDPANPDLVFPGDTVVVPPAPPAP